MRISFFLFAFLKIRPSVRLWSHPDSEGHSGGILVTLLFHLCRAGDGSPWSWGAIAKLPGVIPAYDQVSERGVHSGRGEVHFRPMLVPSPSASAGFHSLVENLDSEMYHLLAQVWTVFTVGFESPLLPGRTQRRPAFPKFRFAHWWQSVTKFLQIFGEIKEIRKNIAHILQVK